MILYEGTAVPLPLKGAAVPLPLKGAAIPLPLKGAAVPLPLKGAAGPLPLKGLTPLAKIGFANASIPSPFPAKNEPPMGDSSALPEFVPKTKGSRFGAMKTKAYFIRSIARL